jgi:hypothetical protein
MANANTRTPLTGTGLAAYNCPTLYTFGLPIQDIIDNTIFRANKYKPGTPGRELFQVQHGKIYISGFEGKELLDVDVVAIAILVVVDDVIRERYALLFDTSNHVGSALDYNDAIDFFHVIIQNPHFLVVGIHDQTILAIV